MNENEYENESGDDEQSQQTMAASYANVVQTYLSRNSKPPDVQDPNEDEIDNPNTVKPIFLQDQDIFGSVKVTKPMWVTHVEIYKTIGAIVDPAAIKGIQRVRSMWRIYMDNEIDRLTLITSGVTMRGRHVGFHTQNRRNPARQRPDTTRIRVKGVPLSADDGQIRRTLEVMIKVRDGEILHMYREQLRVDGRLTGCETGDRIIISKTLTSPMLKAVKIGRYNAYISHQGQPQQTRPEVVCHKCLEPGHFIFNCENEWKCRRCKQTGHKQINCPHAEDGTRFDEEMPQREEFSHDIKDVHEENKDREQVQSEEQNETIEIEKEERQTEHQNEEECSKNIEQNSNKNNVNDSGRKPKGQSNKNNGKSGSIKASDNEASMRKEQNNLGQSSIKSFTTPASKLKSTSQHTPPTPLSREGKKKKKKV